MVLFGGRECPVNAVEIAHALLSIRAKATVSATVAAANVGSQLASPLGPASIRQVSPILMCPSQTPEENETTALDISWKNARSPDQRPASCALCKEIQCKDRALGSYTRGSFRFQGQPLNEYPSIWRRQKLRHRQPSSLQRSPFS